MLGRQRVYTKLETCSSGEMMRRAGLVGELRSEWLANRGRLRLLTTELEDP